MDIGVFIPIGSNGWLISTTSPQYKPSFDLNLEIVQKAEDYGFDFALSMIKLHGFGGPSEFWDYNLESFTLMAGLAARTERIRLFATTAVLTIPPAIAARMAATVDSISHGRFGLNLVAGWQKVEYDQMGLWPGDAVHFERRYRYQTEYMQVMKELWETGESNFQGEFFTMKDCVMKPQPTSHIPIVSAGQSSAGMEFAATYSDYNFSMGVGVNTPTAYAPQNRALIEAAEKTGRDVGAYVLFMVIAAETDEAAQEKWKLYNDGVDHEAIAWMSGQAAADVNAENGNTATRIALPEGAVNMNMGTLVGSYESVARMLDEAASVEGTKGIMLVFDDFLEGMDDFGQRIQPLMATRNAVVPA
ncbi:pyrimidine utilization protein A [Rathayibacter sp. VKM Ac-2803]|uniref:pyrimidine utilization protein A n=1 Tax=Rathayibacter sp. VKM Ac-2803 TaxID=2609256 RepID=UPI00135CE913|nr:pyrimidine utilization protein A [Rathayibacter sp. VKM Ac-2803]MWV48165.1 pyrimidine utilization protein A [Rathayibacter sp. VKM Ac-2803]